MPRFWKFNSFVAVLSVVLLVIAFFAGDHTFAASGQVPDFALSIKTAGVSSYLAFIGVVGVVYVTIITALGLLAGFFRAP